MSRHHGGYGGDEPSRHPSTVSDDCESAPPPKEATFYVFYSISDV